MQNILSISEIQTYYSPSNTLERNNTTHLILRGAKITERMFGTLIESLRKNTVLKTVEIWRTSFVRRSMPVELLEVILDIPTMSFLKIEDCDFYYIGQLTLALIKNKSLETLQLISVKLTEYRLLLKSLERNTNLKQLNLAFNDLGSHFCEELTYLLNVNSTINHIELYGNPITNTGLEMLIEPIIEHNNIINLGIAAAALYECDEIVRILNENKSILELDISHNEFRISESFFTALKANNTLQSIILESLSFGEKEYQYFADILSVNTTLERLSLARNYGGEDGLRCLYDGLEKNTTLRELNLSENLIMNADRLYKILNSENNSITDLDISDNYCLDNDSIIDFVKANKSLLSLNIDGIFNPRSVINALEHNGTILRLNFGCNRGDVPKAILRNQHNEKMKSLSLFEMLLEIV